MCLSTIYENEVNENSIIMKNVQSVKINDNKITLVDLMERVKEIKGSVQKIDLIDNFIVINTK